MDILVPDLILSDLKDSCINFDKEISVVKQIGKGSFGIIYLARLRGEEKVAVKNIVIPPAFDEDQQISYFEAFRKEVWLMRFANSSRFRMLILIPAP